MEDDEATALRDESDQPGDCPKCGMALERTTPAELDIRRTVYTCPMHPEIEQEGPGTCPKCGMGLEPKSVRRGNDEADREAADMSRRFFLATALGVPVLLLAMVPMLSHAAARLVSPEASRWLQFALATPVVLWAGWPLLARGWRSVVTRNLNMFTLI